MEEILDRLKAEKLKECETCSCGRNNYCEFYLRALDDVRQQVKSVGSSDVSGLLPFTDVLELNVCIEKLNTKQITLEEFVSDVWNTAYRVGYDMASDQ